MAEEKDDRVEESVGADPSNDASASDVQTVDGGEQASTGGGTENPMDVFEVWSRILLPGESRSQDLAADEASGMDHANKPFDRFLKVDEQRDAMKISLGLFPTRMGKQSAGERPDDKPKDGTPPDGRSDGRPDGRSPPLSNKADRLRVDVAIEFLALLGASEDYAWKQMCEMVVPQPELMERRYFLQPNEYPDGEIQCLLTLDSIFVACFLMVFLNVYPWMIDKVEDVISSQARDSYYYLSRQLLKPENQVPLDLIKRVYGLLTKKVLETQERDEESMEDMCREVTDFVVGRICRKFVESNGFPSFHTPTFLGTKFVRQIKVQVQSEDVPNPRSKPYACAIECRNLLHCQAEALWGSTFPATYLLEKPSKGDSNYLNLWTPNSKTPATMRNSHPSAVKAVTQYRGKVAKSNIRNNPEEVMQYQEDLKAVLNEMMVQQGIKGTSKVFPPEVEHHMVVEPIADAMRDAVGASSQKGAEQTFNQKVRLWMRKILARAPARVAKVLGRIFKLLLTYFLSKEEVKPVADEAEDPLSSSLPTASELSKYGVTVQGQEGDMFPRFEKHRYRTWRATLYLPKIKVLGKGAEDRWQSLLVYEDRWMHCTGMWDDIMWLYRFRPTSSKENTRKSNDVNGEDQADQSQSDKLDRKNIDTFNPKGRRKPFLSYLQVMDELVNTEADVEILLTGAEPVIHSTNLGSQTAVLEFFNSVTDKYANSKVDDIEWLQLKSMVRDFHNRKTRRMWVTFLDENLGKPWVVISYLVGVSISISSAIQAIYSIKNNGYE